MGIYPRQNHLSFGMTAGVGLIFRSTRRQIACVSGSIRCRYGSVRGRSGQKIAVNYLGVPFTKHFEQPVSIAQCVQRLLLIRHLDCSFKPGRDTWICEDLLESHIELTSASRFGVGRSAAAAE
jgi:hypothetical protein